MNGWQSIDAPGQNKLIVPEPAHHAVLFVLITILCLTLIRRIRRR